MAKSGFLCRVRCRMLRGPPRVVGGLLVGREGAAGMGRGRDAGKPGKRLQRQGVAKQATGGEEYALPFHSSTSKHVDNRDDGA